MHRARRQIFFSSFCFVPALSSKGTGRLRVWEGIFKTLGGWGGVLNFEFLF